MTSVGGVARALIQQSGMGRLEPEERSVHDELVRRGVPVSSFLQKQMTRGRLALDRSTLVVGEVPMVELALRKLGVEVPGDHSYPEALRPFLLRRVWPSTLRDVRRALLDEDHQPMFVKPRDRLKRFTGKVLGHAGDLASLHPVSGAAEVWCSEIVKFVSEHRVFVIDGAIVGIRHYDGDASIALDGEAVERAIAVWTASGDAAAAYGIDFGVLADGQTALIELNDGYALGSYGLPEGVYSDLLIRRWLQLTRG